MLKQTLAVVAAGLTIAATPAPETWNVDNSHTAITFSVKHFFTPVMGSFEDFDVELVYDAEDVSNSTVSANIRVASIDTENERRDGHLQSGDFFDAETYPEITFRSTSVRSAGPNKLVATGPLTIKDVTREVELPITLEGVQEIPAEMQEMLGGVNRVASFTAMLNIDRRDFGVGVGNWAATAVVGGDVEIEIALEANQK